MERFEHAIDRLEKDRRHLSGLVACTEKEGKFEYLGDGEIWKKQIADIDDAISTLRTIRMEDSQRGNDLPGFESGGAGGNIG